MAGLESPHTPEIIREIYSQMREDWKALRQIDQGNTSKNNTIIESSFGISPFLYIDPSVSGHIGPRELPTVNKIPEAYDSENQLPDIP